MDDIAAGSTARVADTRGRGAEDERDGAGDRAPGRPRLGGEGCQDTIAPPRRRAQVARRGIDPVREPGHGAGPRSTAGLDRRQRQRPGLVDRLAAWDAATGQPAEAAVVSS